MQKVMTCFFAATLFLSAALLFQIQLIYAKLLTPQMGGAPAVWITAMVFFQSFLLLGYAYAFDVTRRLALPLQVFLHAALIGISLFFLPAGLAHGDINDAIARPIHSILSVLFIHLGLCFFILSTTTPLVQSWFGRAFANHENPYVFYAASNAGSFVGLLTYPFLIEPNIVLINQIMIWRILFSVYALLVLGAGVVAFYRAKSTVAPKAIQKPSWRSRLYWGICAFIPASMMLSVTTYISSDIAAVPLIWVLILSLYLLTFVLVFSDRVTLDQPQMVEGLAYTSLFVLVLNFWDFISNSWIEMAFHILLFFATAMVFHHQLARTKPDRKFAAEYYLWIALGGALASIFNGIIAPTYFNSTYEYSVVILLAALTMPVAGFVWQKKSISKDDLRLPILLGAGLAIILGLGLQYLRIGSITSDILEFVIGAIFVYSLAAWRLRPPRFALGLLIMMVCGWLSYSNNVPLIAQERSFFGTLKVAAERNGRHILMHGSTMHGSQWFDNGQELMPQTYYTNEGPLGEIYKHFALNKKPYAMAAAGLGAGNVACYAKEGQSLTFFEIDEAVESIARNPEYFTYLSKCPAKVIIGDARLSLNDKPDGTYNMLILDTFSSDAVPVHMLTKEAMAMYKNKLAEGGVIAVHISSRFFNLAPVVAAVATSNDMFVAAKKQTKREGERISLDWKPSYWVLIAKNKEQVDAILTDNEWFVPKFAPKHLWTDGYSSILSAFKTDLLM